jgi:hypothetical protein
VDQPWEPCLGRLAERYTLSVEERRVTEENVVFRLPAPLN